MVNVCDFNGKTLNKRGRVWGAGAKKESAEFDARKFDFITSAVKGVTIRILMGRLPRLKTSRATMSFAAALATPINASVSAPPKTHERLSEGFIDGGWGVASENDFLGSRAIDTGAEM